MEWLVDNITKSYQIFVGFCSAIYACCWLIISHRRLKKDFCKHVEKYEVLEKKVSKMLIEWEAQKDKTHWARLDKLLEKLDKE